MNNFIKRTLNNGVKLYLYLDKNMKKSFVSYGVRYGSSGEYSQFYLDGIYYHVLPGCAHFLEHMLGEHSKYGNLYKRFANKKYITNAFTYMNSTNYFFIGRDDILESIKELIIAIDEPIFTSEDIIKTSEAIIQETKMQRDNKNRVALSIICRNLYKDVELYDESLCSIGNEESTKSLDYDMLKACYDAFYSDDNKILVIGGNFKEEKIVKYIESIYENIPKHENKRKNYQYLKKDIRKKFQVEYMPTNDDYLLIGFKNNIDSFSPKEVNYFIDYLLDSKFRDDTIFIEKLKDKNIISNLEGKNFAFLLNDIVYYIGFSTKNCEKTIRAIKKEIALDNFTKEYFELYKRKQIANHAMRMDYKYDNLKKFLFRLDYTEDFNDISFIRNLSFDRFLEFYKTLNFDNYTVALIKNVKKYQ